MDLRRCNPIRDSSPSPQSGYLHCQQRELPRVHHGSAMAGWRPKSIWHSGETINCVVDLIPQEHEQINNRRKCLDGAIRVVGPQEVRDDYNDGRLILELQLQARGMDLKRYQLRALFQWAIVDRNDAWHDSMCGMGWVGTSECVNACLGGAKVSESEQPMLIKIVQVSQYGQQFRFVSAPAMVRLQAFNLSLHSGTDSTKPAAADTPLEIIRSIADRKHERAFGLRGVDLSGPYCQRINQMVERGSHVVNAISHDQGPSLNWEPPVVAEMNGIPGAIVIWKFLNSIGFRVNPLPEFIFDGFKVSIGTR